MAGESDCYVDDAFCERRSDAHYCTGVQPLVCPAGEVEIGFTCGAPGGAAGGGAVGGASGAGGSG